MRVKISIRVPRPSGTTSSSQTPLSHRPSDPNRTLQTVAKSAIVAVPLVLVLFARAACSGGGSVAPGDGAGAAAVALEQEGQQDADERRSYLTRGVTEGALAEADLLNEEWTGDFDGMIEREAIRALVPMSKTFYFLDGGQQQGISYEAMKLFEEQVNENLGRGHLRVHVVMVPVTRAELIPALVAGHGDIAIGNITMTPERRELVDFSDPLMTGVSEVVVTGPNSPELASLDDLAGQEVVVRESSSYYDSLQRLNARFRDEGKDEIRLTLVQEVLEDEDLLDMVNAGLMPVVVVDSHKADFWAQIFTDVTVRDDLAVATGGEIGWAFRKNSPMLAAEINEFVVDHKKGTLMGNIMFNRYLRDTEWAERALNLEGRRRFNELTDIFERYGDQYDVPWLLVAAQGFQESRLDQSMRSPAGAVGVMQLLPSTAADSNVGIPNIEEVENNIHAGTKYLRFIHNRYFSDNEDMTQLNQALFSFAAYNAGPARVARLRSKAADQGFDPNVWFSNVEIVAAQDIGRETVQYVSNIFKYYVAYARMIAIDEARQDERQQGLR